MAPDSETPQDTGPADLSAIPEEFRPACGRPGTHVIVRHFPVTIPHALCDLAGVALSYPRHGGATVPGRPSTIYNSLGFRLTVHPDTLEVTVDVRLRPSWANR
jgi:hypothetical protein